MMNLSVGTCQNLISRMPDRIQTVRRAKSGSYEKLRLSENDSASSVTFY